MLLISLTAGSLKWVNAQGDSDNQQLQLNKKSSKQTDVSDEELKKFLKISNEMKTLRREQRPKMKEAIQAEGLTMKEFQSMRKRMMGRGQKKNSNRTEGESGEITKKEKQQFKKARKAVQAIQKKTKQKMQKVIKENGLTQKRFRTIYKAIRSNRELQQKLRNMQQGNRQQGGQ